MNPNIGLTIEQLKSTAEILNQTLANEFLLYTKTRKYHWNVVGIHFHDLHKFFENLYEELDESVDEVAERARALGQKAVGTMTEYLNLSDLNEQPGDYPDSKTMLQNLLADHETIIKKLRTDTELVQNQNNDAGTADFLTGLLEKHEKSAWMLRSMLE